MVKNWNETVKELISCILCNYKVFKHVFPEVSEHYILEWMIRCFNYYAHDEYPLSALYHIQNEMIGYINQDNSIIQAIKLYAKKNLINNNRNRNISVS